MQPGTSPNLAQVIEHGGTEFALSALDWFGSTDNRIALWAITLTSSINGFFPEIAVSYTIVKTE